MVLREFACEDMDLAKDSVENGFHNSQDFFASYLTTNSFFFFFFPVKTLYHAVSHLVIS
jgi:hypothetical protein